MKGHTSQICLEGVTRSLVVVLSSPVDQFKARTKRFSHVVPFIATVGNIPRCSDEKDPNLALDSYSWHRR